MTYKTDDILRIVRGIPALHLRSPAQATRWLTWHANIGVELANTLKRYPDVRYAELDMHYTLIQALTVMGPEFLQDLLEHRSYVVAGVLLALSPSVAASPYLEHPVALSAPGTPWWHLRVLNARKPSSDTWSAADGALASLRQQLTPLVGQPVRLRQEPDIGAQLALQVRVREAYRDGGADAALAVLRAQALRDIA